MSDLSNHPRIEMSRTDDLKPNPKNPRTHSDKQIQLIANSITRFGFLIPIIIDETGCIAAGHARWLAAKLLNLTEVPTIKVSFLSKPTVAPSRLQTTSLPSLRATTRSYWPKS